MAPQVASFIRFTHASFVVALMGVSFAAESSVTQTEGLAEQNRRLHEQVRAQQRIIDEIHAKMADLTRASERHERDLRALQDQGDAPLASSNAPVGARTASGETALRVSAEAALTFFRTGREGQYPSGAFRADDPTVMFEAPVRKGVYFYTELKLLPRETNEENFQLGEIYVDFESVLARWGQPDLLNIRAGRLNIPFGEEYLVRGPIANPLISHSLSDTWGVDEGVEIYGRAGPMQYVVAVQNGGVSRLSDFHSDKSVTARVGWNPARWLYVSGSAMTTGQLSTEEDELSELWFGNAFFRALGPTTTTATFSAKLFEADATVRWKGGHLKTALGHVRFDDSDTRADNSRRLRYGSLEVVQEIATPLFAAARYSEIRAPRGYPLAGWAPLGAFFFRPGVLTEELRRMSVGLGYRFGPPLVLKAEYTWESGRMTTGAARDHENFFGTQLGVKF